MIRNPLHPRWKVYRGRDECYEFAELADWVELPKFIPKRKPEEVGIGRNVTLFDFMRQYAYRHIRHYKWEVKNFVLWQAHLYEKALEPVQNLLSSSAKHAKWMNSKLVLSSLSQFFHNRLFFSSQAKLRSTTQR